MKIGSIVYHKITQSALVAVSSPGSINRWKTLNLYGNIVAAFAARLYMYIISEHGLQRSRTSSNVSVRRVTNLYSNNTFRETNSDGVRLHLHRNDFYV